MNLVFTNELGGHHIPQTVDRHYKQLVTAIGRPDARFHDLRHSAACILYSNGMGIKELQRWMRHGKIEMTADVYLHISKEREKELADGLQNMLSRAPKSKDNFIDKKSKWA